MHIEELTLSQVTKLLQEHGANRIIAKRLAANDNSKNQIYLAGTFDLLNILPFSGLRLPYAEEGKQIMHADLRLSWVTEEGNLSPAPNTKLILYPQYPEVRLSGFLLGSKGAPNDLLRDTARVPGRLLLLGIRSDRTVVAAAFSPQSRLAKELQQADTFGEAATLVDLPVLEQASETLLLDRLRDIADMGWVRSRRLSPDGSDLPCEAMNCGGHTLEALLGIVANSRSEPDFEGWEVKQFGVRDFKRFAARSPITLFTPEPTGGVYVTQGVEAFVRRYGYPDKKGRSDRLNFGGKFVAGSKNARTSLTLRLAGYNRITGKIERADGGLELVDSKGVVAAAWPFASLIAHWNRKHAQAAYVPSLMEGEPRRYRFGHTVFLGQGTHFGRFLAAVADGTVYYDPGIKLERASSAQAAVHRRSQFRVAFPRIGRLYRDMARIVLPDSR